MIYQKKPSILLAFCIFLISSGVCHAQARGTGLEIQDHETIYVLVERLNQQAQNIGLIPRRIQSRTELRLQQANLKIADRDDGAYLYINVNVVGQGFSITATFNRLVHYADSAGDLRYTYAATWREAGSGIHAGDSEYIVQALDSLLDSFINEYLKAN